MKNTIEYYNLLEDKTGYQDIKVEWGELEDEWGIRWNSSKIANFGNNKQKALEFCKDLEEKGYKKFKKPLD